jgi:hypothetical protein
MVACGYRNPPPGGTYPRRPPRAARAWRVLEPADVGTGYAVSGGPGPGAAAAVTGGRHVSIDRVRRRRADAALSRPRRPLSRTRRPRSCPSWSRGSGRQRARSGQHPPEARALGVVEGFSGTHFDRTVEPLDRVVQRGHRWRRVRGCQRGGPGRTWRDVRIRPEIRAETTSESPPDFDPAAGGLLPGGRDEYIVTTLGLKG